jgi:hypothetical protein
MPDSAARTKAGKQRFVKKAMDEFKAGEMRSGSGRKVTDPKQAIAIALSQTGQSRPAGQSQTSGKPAGRGGSTARLSQKLDRRLDKQ